MCLFVGSKSKFVAKHDIIVYKRLSKISNGEWVTPDRVWPIEFNKVLIPEGVARERKYGYRYVIEEGAIHAYTFSPDSKKACEEFFVAKIPAGTTFWLQDDLREVAAEKMIITTEHPEPGEKMDLSDYYHLGVDVYLKGGKRAKNDESFSVSEIIGLVASDNRVISIKVEETVLSRDVIVDPKNEYPYIDDFEIARKDMNGYTNTKSLEKHLKDNPAIDICKKLGEDWYIPALGELREAFSNLLCINLTLRKLNLPIIEYRWFWSSSVKTRKCAWYCDSDGYYNWHYHNYVHYRYCVLPFLEL